MKTCQAQTSDKDIYGKESLMKTEKKSYGVTLAPMLAAFSLLLIANVSFADCSSAYDEAHSGYRDAKKAYRHFSNADEEAEYCGCSFAQDEAASAYRDAKKARRASDLDFCRTYARKAYRHATNSKTGAEYCGL
jgi:hypothetical protein